MSATAVLRVTAQQQVRFYERAFFGAFTRWLEAAVAAQNQFAGLQQFLDVGFDIFQLIDRSQGAHAHAFD